MKSLVAAAASAALSLCVITPAFAEDPAVPAVSEAPAVPAEAPAVAEAVEAPAVAGELNGEMTLNEDGTYTLVVVDSVTGEEHRGTVNFDSSPASEETTMNVPPRKHLEKRYSSNFRPISPLEHEMRASSR